MKIQSLALERYGAFTDRVLTFDPDARLHVVIGPNEAGKSSALAAITDLLFGFGKNTPYDFRHESKLLRVGGVFRSADGRGIAIRRRKGNKNTLLDADDNALPDDVLAPLLGTMTRDIFTSEFGLNAQTLRDGGEKLLNAGGRLAETLAASSAGLTVLSDLRSRYGEEADQLFTPRRSSRPFYVLVDRFEDAVKQVAAATVTPDALKAALENVASAEARYADCARQHDATGRDLARLSRAQRTRNHLIRLNTLRASLADHAGLAAVTDAELGRWQAALADHDRIRAELQRLAQDDAADADNVAGLKVDEAILARAETIEALVRRMEVIRKGAEDLQRRQTERSLAQDALQDCARRLGIASHAELLAQMPTDLALADVRDRIAGAKDAERIKAEADRRLQVVMAERDRLQREAPAASHAADPAPLRRQLQVFADIPKVADRVRTERLACDRDAGQLDAALAALDPRLEHLAGPVARSLPDDAVMAEHERRVSDLASELQRAKARLSEAEHAVETIELEVTRFARSGAVTTREDLLKVRAERDAAMQVHEAALDDAAARMASLHVVRRLIDAADRVADQLVTDSERAAQFGALLDRKADAIRDAERAANALRDVSDRSEQARQAWAVLWQPAAILPRQPGEMRKWLARVDDLQHRAEAIEERRAGLQADADWLDESRASLISLLAALGGQADAATPMDLLYRDAELRLNELSVAWTEVQKRAVTFERAERDVLDAQRAVTAADAGVASSRATLPAVFVRIGVPDGATLAAAEAALTVWGAVGTQKLSFENADHRVKSINDDIQRFDAEVRGLVDAVAPELATRAVMDGLKELEQRLAQAQRADAQRASRNEAIAARAATRQALIASSGPIDATLDIARAVLGLAEGETLATALEKVDRRNRLANELATASAQLPESADGLDEATLRAEQVDLDHDALAANIERLEALRQQILVEMGNAQSAIDQAKRERDDLSRGRDATGAARLRAEAAGEIRDVVDRWLVRAAATRLAGHAIERHRQMVQDPLLERASELFAIASGAAFAGLAVDYGEDDQPVVVAVRKTDERVGVRGLSEGSRDQLFLSLRLALLERRTVETLPFIGDDLLASFDERRTASTLSLLASTTADRQAIIFTHHRHVADIAQSLTDLPVAVIEL